MGTVPVNPLSIGGLAPASNIAAGSQLAGDASPVAVVANPLVPATAQGGPVASETFAAVNQGLRRLVDGRSPEIPGTGNEHRPADILPSSRKKLRQYWEISSSGARNACKAYDHLWEEIEANAGKIESYISRALVHRMQGEDACAAKVGSDIRKLKRKVDELFDMVLSAYRKFLAQQAANHKNALRQGRIDFSEVRRWINEERKYIQGQIAQYDEKRKYIQNEERKYIQRQIERRIEGILPEVELGYNVCNERAADILQRHFEIIDECWRDMTAWAQKKGIDTNQTTPDVAEVLNVGDGTGRAASLQTARGSAAGLQRVTADRADALPASLVPRILSGLWRGIFPTVARDGLESPDAAVIINLPGGKKAVLVIQSFLAGRGADNMGSSPLRLPAELFTLEGRPMGPWGRRVMQGSVIAKDKDGYLYVAPPDGIGKFEKLSSDGRPAPGWAPEDHEWFRVKAMAVTDSAVFAYTMEDKGYLFILDKDTGKILHKKMLFERARGVTNMETMVAVGENVLALSMLGELFVLSPEGDVMRMASVGGGIKSFQDLLSNIGELTSLKALAVDARTRRIFLVKGDAIFMFKDGIWYKLRVSGLPDEESGDIRNLQFDEETGCLLISCRRQGNSEKGTRDEGFVIILEPETIDTISKRLPPTDSGDTILKLDS